MQKEKKSESGIDPQNGFSRGHRAERGGKHTKKSDSNQATINFALIEQLHSLGSMIVGSVGDGGGSLGIGGEQGGIYIALARTVLIHFYRGDESSYEYL